LYSLTVVMPLVSGASTFLNSSRFTCLPASRPAGGQEVREVVRGAGDARQHERGTGPASRARSGPTFGCSSIFFSVLLQRLRRADPINPASPAPSPWPGRRARRLLLGGPGRRRLEAVGGRELGEGGVGEGLLSASISSTFRGVDRGGGHAARGRPPLSRRSVRYSSTRVERVSGAPDRGHHARGHLLQLGLGLEHLPSRYHPLQLLDLVLGVAHGERSRDLTSFLVGVLRRLELLAGSRSSCSLTVLSWRAYCPAALRLPTFRLAGGLAAKVTLLRLEVLHLAQQALTESRRGWRGSR